MHESSISKVRRVLVLYILVIFLGLVSGWLREWILSDLGFILGVILEAQINDKNIEKSMLSVFFFLLGPGEALGAVRPCRGVGGALPGAGLGI